MGAPRLTRRAFLRLLLLAGIGAGWPSPSAGPSRRACGSS